ncbi:MAG: DUF4886 domain-containing protein, partial [Clostridia bacterium]|nr:DUF4886 domain-containing protein [Clostridia bacterium]
MKKIVSLLALLLVAMMLLVACGGTATTGTTAGTQGTTAGGTTAGTTASTQGTQGTQGTTGGTTTPGDQPDYSKSIKILAVGNSFSVDAMEHLAVILKAAGVEEIVLGNLYIGGCSLDTHMKNINMGSTSSEYYKNTGDGWSSTKNESIDTGLMDEEWDIVTIQQVSQDSGKPETFTYLTQIVEYIKNTVLNEDVKVYWHMTWAYQAGYNDTNKFGAYNNDQMTMYNAITDATQNTVLKNSLIDGFIPSGTAIQNLRTSYFGDALTRDGFHLSYDVGRYTAALMWYKQITGADLSDLAAAPSSYPGIIEHLPAIKEAVDAAYAKPFEVTKSTKTEYVNELTIMTDADKSYLASLGLDPAKYEVLDLKLLFSAYYNSTASSNFAKPVNNAGNSPQFMATGIFTSQTLPVGSVVKIADGYQYRLEGWQKLGTKNDQTRRDNSTENITITEDLYKVYNFMAFNISHLPVNEVVADVVYDDRTALRIYVPIAAEESTEMTAGDKEYLTALGLNPDNYVKV